MSPTPSQPNPNAVATLPTRRTRRTRRPVAGRPVIQQARSDVTTPPPQTPPLQTPPRLDNDPHYSASSTSGESYNFGMDVAADAMAGRLSPVFEAMNSTEHIIDGARERFNSLSSIAQSALTHFSNIFGFVPDASEEAKVDIPENVPVLTGDEKEWLKNKEMLCPILYDKIKPENIIYIVDSGKKVTHAFDKNALEHWFRLSDMNPMSRMIVEPHMLRSPVMTE